MGTHISENIEKYIGKYVRIEYFDGNSYTGLLQKTEFDKDFTNAPYKLLNFDNRGNTLVLYKSHIKDIKEI